MYDPWEDDLKGGRRRSMSLPDYSMPPSLFEDGTNSPTSDSDDDGAPSFGFRSQGFPLEMIPEGELPMHTPSRLKFEHPSAPKPNPSPRHHSLPHLPSPLQFQHHVQPQQPPQQIHQQQQPQQLPQQPHFTLNLQGLYSEFQEDAIRFDVMYQVHFHKIFEAVKLIRLDSIRDEVLSFWPKTRRFFNLFQNPVAMHQILNIDALFYQSLINLLIPEPFHYLPIEVSTLAIELSRLLPVWLHNATQFALPLAFSEEKIRVVKQYCTVLHKRALINNLGGRVATQLQSGQEPYGLNDPSKRKAEETDSKYARMLSDWMQIDFSFISFPFAFDSSEWEMLEGTGFHTETLVPPDTIDQMATLLQRRAGINDWTDWLRDAVLSRCPPDSMGDSNSVLGRPIHQLVLKWSMFLSNILTELTLMQAKSVKQFRLLFEWIEAVLSHQMEIHFAKTDTSKTQMKTEDNLGFTASTGSFWREQTRQLKQQVEFLTGKIALLEQQLHATKLNPSTPPTYFPTSPKMHRPDEAVVHAQGFSPRLNPFAPEGYIAPAPGSVEAMSVSRPFPFSSSSFSSSHRPRTHSQPSPEIRFSDWDEENEDENERNANESMLEENSESSSSNENLDAMTEENGEKGQKEQAGGGGRKKILRKSRSGSGLERRRPRVKSSLVPGGSSSGGAMYIDSESTYHNTSTTTNSAPFLTLSGFIPTQQEKSPRVLSAPMFHVTQGGQHPHSFSQPNSPTYIVADHAGGGAGGSGLGGSGGTVTTASVLGGSGERYLSAPVPRGGRLRSNSNPSPFIEVSELWMGDRSRKPPLQPKQEGGGGGHSGVTNNNNNNNNTSQQQQQQQLNQNAGGFPFMKPTSFEDTSTMYPYFNKNYSVKTGE